MILDLSIDSLYVSDNELFNDFLKYYKDISSAEVDVAELLLKQRENFEIRLTDIDDDSTLQFSTEWEEDTDDDGDYTIYYDLFYTSSDCIIKTLIENGEIKLEHKIFPDGFKIYD